MSHIVDSVEYKKVLGIGSATYERDKFSKILQYGYKYYAWKAGNEGRAKDAALYSKISSTLSMARKLSRLGYPLVDVANFFRNISLLVWWHCLFYVAMLKLLNIMRLAAKRVRYGEVSGNVSNFGERILLCNGQCVSVFFFFFFFYLFIFLCADLFLPRALFVCEGIGFKRWKSQPLVTSTKSIVLEFSVR